MAESYYSRTIYDKTSLGDDTFIFDFDYVSQRDVHVSIDGNETYDFEFLDTHTVKLHTPLKGGEVVTVFRNTFLETRTVDFVNAAELTEKDLDDSADQVFYAMQEAYDLARDSIKPQPDGSFSMSNRPLKEVADPQNPTDAANRNYVDAQYGINSALRKGITEDKAASAASAAKAEGHELETKKHSDIAVRESENATSKAQEAHTAMLASESARDLVLEKTEVALAVEQAVRQDKQEVFSRVADAETYKIQAGESKDQALNHELKAKKWAEEAPNVQVEPSRYSAKHYVVKAEQWAEKAVDSPVEPGAYSAKHYAEKTKGLNNISQQLHDVVVTEATRVEQDSLTASVARNQAVQAANNAALSEANADNSAYDADQARQTAQAHSVSAKSSMEAAQASQEAAALSETEAKKSQDAAKVSQDASKASETKAKTSETNAKASELAAKTSQTASKTSETNAKASETAASTSEANAATSASTATTQANKAVLNASNAASSAGAAATSETNAKNSELAAAASETEAAKSQTAAKASELAASNSQTAAKTSEDKAKASELAAASSKSAAAASQAAAKTSETNAKASEEAAADSEAVAVQSATDAAASASSAATSASSAGQSKIAAAASQTAAKTSETNAKASETAANTSETNAKASETAAKDSETNAKASETSASNSASSALSSKSTAVTKASEAKASQQAAATSEANAKTSEVNAASSEAKAKEWASKPEGQEVEPGIYSSRHYAEQAKAAVNGARIYMSEYDASSGTLPIESPQISDKGKYWVISAPGTLPQVGVVDIGTEIIINDDLSYGVIPVPQVYLRRGENLSDVTNVAAARNNLGLGDAALKSVGTGASSLPTTGQADARYLKKTEQHNHAISDVTGLQGALDGKSDVAHNHDADYVSSVNGKTQGSMTIEDAGSSAMIMAKRIGGQFVRLSAGNAGSAIKFSNTGSFGFGPVESETDVSRATALTISGSGEVSINGGTPWRSNHQGPGTGMDADTVDGKHASAFANAVHEHHWSEVTGKPSTATRWPAWSEVTGKPSKFTPVAHDHSISDVTGLQAALDGKSESTHGHPIGKITGLQEALNGKSDTGHGHKIADITGLQASLNSKLGATSNAVSASKLAAAFGLTLGGDLTGTVNIDGSKSVTLTATVKDDSHNHVIANVDGLQAALDGKSAVGHGHAIDDVSGLQSALDGKSPTGHTHAIGDVTGLQAALNGKLATGANAVSASKWATARTLTLGGDLSGSVSVDGTKDVTLTASVKDDSHAHTISTITGLQGALDGKLNAGATAVAAAKLATARTISLAGDATGSTSFNGASNSTLTVTVKDNSHNHTIGNVTGLQEALDGKEAKGTAYSKAQSDNRYLSSGVSSATDWNKATGNGVIYQSLDGLNAPISGWLQGTFFAHNDTHGTQIVWTFTLDKVRKFTRNMRASAWTPWVEEYNTGNFNPDSKANTTGTYAIRATSTTKADVGLSNVRNVDAYAKTETYSKEQVDAAVADAVKAAMPRGIVSMWSGTLTDIPAGWALCDGTNGTPDLTDKFIVGAGGRWSPGDVGGTADAVVVAHTHSASASNSGSHSHSGTTEDAGNHSHSTYTSHTGRENLWHTNGNILATGATQDNPRWRSGTVGTAGNHKHTFSTNTTGSHTHEVVVESVGESGVDKNLPPYYALAYVMKL